MEQKQQETQTLMTALWHTKKKNRRAQNSWINKTERKTTLTLKGNNESACSIRILINLLE